MPAKETDNMVKLDLWGTSVNIIMKYSISAIARTQASDGKMQKSATKCLMGVILGEMRIGKTIKLPTIWLWGISAPTIYPQLLRGKLGDIRSWRAALSPAYLNNMQECGNVINRWGISCGCMRDILLKITNGLYIIKNKRWITHW